MKVNTKTIMNIEAACDANKIVAHIPADQKHIKVGVLYGHAADFAQRANPAGGAPFKGFAGSFQIDPLVTDEAKGGYTEATASATLFLPDAISAQVRETLGKLIYPDPKKPEKKSRGAVEFVATIFVAKTEHGPAWGMDWVIPPRPIDALAAVKDFYNRSIGEAHTPEQKQAVAAKAKAK